MRLWIGLALIAICVGSNLAQLDEYDWYGLPDSSFQSQEYEDQVSTETKDDNLDVVKEQPDGSNNNDDKVNEDTENFLKSLEHGDDNPDESILNDYQFEDNRSEPKDEQNIVLSDEQKDMMDVPADDKYFESEEKSKVDGLDEQIDADYNNSPDTKQFDDDNMYMDENPVIKPLDNENKSTLMKDVLEEDDINENKPLYTDDDILNKIFGDAENEKIRENIESIEETNQLVKDLSGDIAGSENVVQNNAIDEKSEEIQGEVVSQHEVESINSSEDFDESQQPINQNTDSEKFYEYNVENNENHEDKPIDEDELDTKAAFEEQNQSVSPRDSQNENTSNEGQENKNEEPSNDFVQYDDESQAANNENLVAVNANDENESEEDKIYSDLGDDLKKLFETWDELQEDDTIKEDDNVNIGDYEEKYNKPYRESNILSAREYDEGTDDIDDDVENVNEKEDEMKKDDKIDETINDNGGIVVLPTILDKNVSLIAQKDFVNNDEAFYRNDSSIVQKSDDIEIAEKAAIENPIDSITETSNDYDKYKSTLKATNFDDITPRQYDDLMRQFSVYNEDLEIKSGDHVAPIHISLSADKAVVIESPDYPNNYPTNNVIDYYFDGLGTGIELNITDFSVNGALGDYLLVKPGGIDASDELGFVFSYHLNVIRRYRFLSVDRLFVRFFAHPGIPMFKGYQFSVKMICPPEENEEIAPEPEPLLPPVATHTVTLGGTSLEDFADIEEDFRLLIAEMATAYINANDIDVGLNSTSEATQITKTSLCNVNWPGFESCVAVTFGVPLQYDDDQPPRLNETDLSTMWDTYVGQDPFAARLARMGITEFDSPNDRRVLTVWLVLAAGVLISVAMLAFALWRFSCFEDYTRMAAYSDTDSINDKKVLDMYPTPHQTFPSLYSEQQLKWDDEKFDDTTRVDMGGYANRSYKRDDMMDMDSDEDIVTSPRDRNSISPRDIYEV